MVIDNKNKINIYLTNKGFEKCYLHYMIEKNIYFVVANTKKYNRKLKKVTKQVRERIINDGFISKNEKLYFNTIKFELGNK